jgi:hypothetical protein
MINNVFNIIEIEVEKIMSVSVLTYELYGEFIQNEDQLEYLKGLIIGLNPDLPAHAFKGTVKVLQVG